MWRGHSATCWPIFVTAKRKICHCLKKKKKAWSFPLNHYEYARNQGADSHSTTPYVQICKTNCTPGFFFIKALNMIMNYSVIILLIMMSEVLSFSLHPASYRWIYGGKQKTKKEWLHWPECSSDWWTSGRCCDWMDYQLLFLFKLRLY